MPNDVRFEAAPPPSTNFNDSVSPALMETVCAWSTHDPWEPTAAATEPVLQVSALAEGVTPVPWSKVTVITPGAVLGEASEYTMAPTFKLDAVQVAGEIDTLLSAMESVAL
jgi:hypothetical protein